MIISYKKLLELQKIDESITEPILRRTLEIEILEGKSLLDLSNKEAEEIFIKYSNFYKEYAKFDINKIEAKSSFKLNGNLYTIPDNIKESISFGQFLDIEALSKTNFLDNFPLIIATLVLGRDATNKEIYKLAEDIANLDYVVVFGLLNYFENKKKAYTILSNTYQIARESLKERMEMILTKTLEKGSVGIVSSIRYRVVMWLKNSKLFNSIF